LRDHSETVRAKLAVEDVGRFIPSWPSCQSF
jgi:hypothetical protein